MASPSPQVLAFCVLPVVANTYFPSDEMPPCDQMPPRAARTVGMVSAALCVVYALIVCVGGWQYVKKMYDVGIEMQDIPVAQWVPRLILPLGFALLALRFTQAFVQLARGEKTTLLSDEAEEALKLRQDPLGEVRE